MIDYQLEDTVFLPFTTRAFATGIPTVLAGTPAIDIYEDATATPIITGETLVVSLNSVVGFNMITVTATAATGFNVGGHYTAIIQAGTVGGVSVVGEVVGEFTIDNSAAAKDLANATDGLTALAADIATAQADLDIITGTAGALIDDGTGAGQIALTAGAIDNVTTVATTTTNTDMRGTDSALLAASINLTAGAVDNVTTVATTTTNTDMRGTDSALLAASINLTAGAVDNVTTVATTTTNTDMRGTDSAATAATVGVAGAGLTDLGGMSTGMKAEVLVEANAALDTAISELAQAAPTATPTMRTGLMLLYMALRNRLDVNTSGTDELQIFNNAGTVIAKKLLTDDGSDYSEAEAISGP